QVAVILRLTHLPTFHNVNTIHSASCLTRVFDLGSFCRLKGVVIGLSALTKYTLSTRYHCLDEDCEGFHGNHYIRVHSPGASETQTVRKDFKCAFCYCTLAEDKSRRTLSERLVAEVVPDNVISLLGHESERARLQALPVYIRDDLTRLVEIGEVYEIIGRTRKDIQEDRITISVEANNIKKVKMGISTRQLLQETPRNLLKLY
ncbi:MCMD2-like protein, partial [Mya arenaria]